MATNVNFETHKVTREERAFTSKGSFRGCTLWFTGLSGAGKTTVAFELERQLVAAGVPCYGLDGDNCRNGINKDLGFKDEDRVENIRRVAEISNLFADSNQVAICSFISPFKADRDVARKVHADAGIPFYEVHVATPLETCEARDSKGLYAKARAGTIPHFTGISSPYEAPENPEIKVGADGESVEAIVTNIITFLRENGAVPGAPTVTELFVAEADKAAKTAAAAGYTKLEINKVSMQWLQVLAEGWASPLKGFMNETQFLQTIHFNQIDGVNQSVPIVLPCDAAQKAAIEGKDFITLVFEGKDVAIMKAPGVYDHVKEERAARTFGLHWKGHPYVAKIFEAGDFLVGGELEVLEKITWGDGLDKFRKTPLELQAEFKRRGCDAVFAFQLRNPVHNGHALLMQDTHEKLRARGYKKPTLLLHPLGGWCKDDDVPLPVRMKQHDCVLAEKVLDPDFTVLAIFPSPMIYAGPTEVQWHCKARMNAGATHYIVGRDPAGMAHPDKALDKDMFLAHHGRNVLSMAPGLEAIEIVPFKFAAYDSKKVSNRPGNPLGAMNFFDPARADDFVKISGSKMRKFAREGVTPPDGYMCPTGWTVVANFYKEKAAKEAAAAAEPAAKKARTA